MSLNRRRAPVIFPREGIRELPRPHFIQVPPPPEIVASANPAIPFICGRWTGQRVEWSSGAVPRYQPFPYFDQSQQPGINAIPFLVVRSMQPSAAPAAVPAFRRLIPFREAAVNATIPMLVVRSRAEERPAAARTSYFPFPQFAFPPPPPPRTVRAAAAGLAGSSGTSSATIRGGPSKF